jgi:vancomycin aglycone glucosyltransferase
MTAAPAAASTPITPEVARRMAEASVAAQFETIGAAARGVDAIVAATALQIAARTIAEREGARYVFVAYCPAVLPSPHHAPIPLRTRGEMPAPPDADNRELWKRDAERFTATFGAALDAQRAALGLSPIDDVRSHVVGDAPWLAADPVIAPWPTRGDADAPFQSGAWLVRDDRPLAPELEAFLDAGEPPVYFGFGSIRAAPDLSRTMIESARALGRRAIVSRGWGELSTIDDGRDTLAIGEVNQQALFPRVAAVVHHGGAGTTTVATRAGAPQVVVPQMYDQFYWARRVRELGIGVEGEANGSSLGDALSRALSTDIAERTRDVATRVRDDGAAIAARRLIGLA